LNYTLMHKSVPIVELDIDEVTGSILKIGEIYNLEHLPIGITISNGQPDRDSLNKWWIGRSIPASRSGIRDALETMNIDYPQLLLTKCLGLSLSDQYWVNSKITPTVWKKVNFFENPFSEDVGNALFGRNDKVANLDFMSPDNTSDGWLKKKWIIANGKRCLVKGGSGATQQEPFNELLATAILRRLGIPHTPYTLLWDNNYPYSVCEDFITPQTDLVSAHRIMETQKREYHTSKYNHYLRCCNDLGIEGVKESLDYMLTLDYLIANEDRHLNNFGVVRDAQTLKFIGVAPIFDSGTSMWHDIPTVNIFGDMDMPSKPFENKHSQQIKLVSNFDWLNKDALYGIEDEWNDILSTSTYIDIFRRDALVAALKFRVKALDKIAVQNIKEEKSKSHEQLR
jgi:hypothetical protein